MFLWIVFCIDKFDNIVIQVIKKVNKFTVPEWF